MQFFRTIMEIGFVTMSINMVQNYIMSASVVQWLGFLPIAHNGYH